ncbi:MAG: zinc-dependent peptidase [Gammaproteobacteria bacterium]|nr:zinc-dependent peptidase [Pseudomonadales bacterium]MCP5345462.1 zinc-dependent peptidase [Pseudomonadales bacterium]
MSATALMSFVTLLLILAAVVFYVIYWPELRLRRILALEFPSAWREIVARRLPFFNKMPERLQNELQDLIKVFLHDKNFVGCAGQEIDDEIRVTVAAQACLLLLNRETDYYRHLESILIYPSTFVATRSVRDELGLISTDHAVLLGESWDQGKVILSWDSVEEGVRNFHDGHNVVLHEFAHQLDHASGSSNGAPLLRTRGAYQSWAHVLSSEFEELQRDAEHGRRSLLDHYGATNPAEFFAVATETFFERPEQMREGHRELYRELVNFYQVDPAEWWDAPGQGL